MSARDAEVAVTLSILDRLTGSRATPSRSWGDFHQLRASLCQDLSDLLNTRRSEDDWDSNYPEAANSLLTYGIPDFTSYNLQNAVEQERVRRSIERAIRRFEPRLTRVTVVLEETDPLRPTLRFQISAVLKMEPSSEAVLF